jgi:hypothetical protein
MTFLIAHHDIYTSGEKPSLQGKVMTDDRLITRDDILTHGTTLS